MDSFKLHWHCDFRLHRTGVVPYRLFLILYCYGRDYDRSVKQRWPSRALLSVAVLAISERVIWSSSLRLPFASLSRLRPRPMTSAQDSRMHLVQNSVFSSPTAHSLTTQWRQATFSRTRLPYALMGRPSRRSQKGECGKSLELCRAVMGLETLRAPFSQPPLVHFRRWVDASRRYRCLENIRLQRSKVYSAHIPYDCLFHRFLPNIVSFGLIHQWFRIIFSFASTPNSSVQEPNWLNISASKRLPQ